MTGISPKHVFTVSTEFKFHDFVFLKSFLGSVIQKTPDPGLSHVELKKNYEKAEKEVSHKKPSSSHSTSHSFARKAILLQEGPKLVHCLGKN